MDMERTEDFRTLLAKFQNDSNFSSILLQSAKKPPSKTSPVQSTDDHSAPCLKPKPLPRVQVLDLKQRTKQVNYTSQKSDLTQIKPAVLPRVRFRELSEEGRSRDRKDLNISETNCETASLVEESQKQHPGSCLHPHEPKGTNRSFHNMLHTWERTLSQSDQMCSTPLPPPYTHRTASLGQSQISNVTVSTEGKVKMAERQQGVVRAATKPPSHLYIESIPFPTTSPPVPPRVHTRLEKVTAGFPPNGYDLNKPGKALQSSNGTGRWHDTEETKFPKIKPLPSIKELGVPPKKPPRPPKVDLSVFQQYLPDDAYMTPEMTEIERLNNYEESISYIKQPEGPLSSIPLPIHSSKPEKKQAKKQPFLIATNSPEIDNAKQSGLYWNDEMPNQQAKEMIKICSHRGIFAKTRINGSEKHMSQEETFQSFSGEGLAEDGNFSDDYVCLQSLKTDERKGSPVPRMAELEQSSEKIYDDVEGIQRDLQASDAYRPFTLDPVSDDTYEETYEDIQSEIPSESCNSAKSDDVKVEKLKGLGKFFKGKFRIKNANLKDNFRSNLSYSVPNLDVMAQENIRYDDFNTDQNDTNPSSRNLFKAKKYILEKNSKMIKEEQLFRERFTYNKEITVINTAVAHCSNTLAKGKLDLRISAGEQLEVIDIPEGNKLICRNSEGKYGYVLLEHLDFK